MGKGNCQHRQPLALKKNHLEALIPTGHGAGRSTSPGKALAGRLRGDRTRLVLHQVSYGNDARAGTARPLWHSQPPSKL